MKTKRSNRRLLKGTRGRVIQLLRRRQQTVNELAGALGVTDNAVRSHLSNLGRDGLVEQVGARPGVRKPESVYGLTPEAEQLFPKAYGVLFTYLLDALSERSEPEVVDGLLREVGRRVAADVPAAGWPAGGRARLEQAVEVLSNLGGLAELIEEDGTYIICGYSCPLAVAVDAHPEVCRLAEALLAEVVGRPVREQCRRGGEAPQCAFVVSAGG